MATHRHPATVVVRAWKFLLDERFAGVSEEVDGVVSERFALEVTVN